MQYSAEFNLKKVVILDYHLGNLFSVKQACDILGINSVISSDKNEIKSADGVILPGVGAFREAMTNLEKLDLINPLKDFVNSSKPLFGICLGLQLLFTESEEFGSSGGLDIIPGTIQKFTTSKSLLPGAKVPNIGWNNITQENILFENSPLCDVNNNEYMYFVHSYFVNANDNSIILSKTNYMEVIYCSSIQSKNIFATQFHPEKSGVKGLSIYRNWALRNNLL